jgi:hypothetical protein
MWRMEFYDWRCHGLLGLSPRVYCIEYAVMRSILLVGGTMVHGENHRPVTSHWQALSHKVVNLQKLGSNSISLGKRVFIQVKWYAKTDFLWVFDWINIHKTYFATMVPPTNKINIHDTTEMLLKVALSTHNPNAIQMI